MLRLGIKPVSFELIKSSRAGLLESYSKNGLMSFDFL
jgi:hypothetical protein